MNDEPYQLLFDFAQPYLPLTEVATVLYEMTVLKTFEDEMEINFDRLNANEQRKLLISIAKDRIPEPWIIGPVITLIKKLHKEEMPPF